MKIDSKKKAMIFIGCVLGLLVLTLLLALVFGSINIPIKDVVKVLTGQDTSSKVAFIIKTIRLPRALAGIAAGAALATAGVLLQSVMNTSLASPNIIGVNSGAGFFVMLSMALFPQSLFSKSVMAFLGALFTSLCILALAFFAEKSRTTIVLAGIAVSSFLSAGMNMLKTLDSDLTVSATQFLIGSLAGNTFKSIKVPAIAILVTIIISIFLSRALNILTLGDGVARSLGLSVDLFRIIFVILASLLAGMAVSFGGLIGFVGLIVPHIVRFFVGHDARVLIPASAITGAFFVMAADLLGRVFFSPYELPVGIILSLLGAPFFLYLLMKKGARRVNA